jgi:hypothetical protein
MPTSGSPLVGSPDESHLLHKAYMAKTTTALPLELLYHKS